MLLFILLNTTIPLDSPLNSVIDYLQTRGFVEMQTVRPFELNDILSEIDTLVFLEERLNSIDRSFIQVFGPYLSKSSDFYTIINMDGKHHNLQDFYANFDLQFSGRITNSITFGEAIRFHFGSKIDSAGPKPWEDIAQAYLNEGFFKIAGKNTNLIIGRRNLLLGFGEEYSLLLSPANEGYDGFFFSHTGRYYEFNSTFSIFNTAPLKFISTHRIGLNLNNLKLGFSEAILWADEVLPLYLNFLLPYYLSQWGMNRNDNIMWCLDGSVNLFNTILSAEFLIDDYQFSEPPPEYDEYPHKLAFQCGLKQIVFERIQTKLNYTFVDKWVYTHRIPENIYESDSLCLGFPLGDDVDKWIASIGFLNRKRIVPRIRFEFTRKGEGSIFLPYEIERGPAYPAFPSGVVEKRLVILPGIEWYAGQRFYLNIEAGREYIHNMNHIPGSDENKAIFKTRIWFLL